jgi:HlyD family secretion protein
MVLVMLVAAFMVRLPVTVEGQGALMADTEVIGYAIMPESDGRLEEFFVKVGSVVKKGDVIGRVSNPRLENDIRSAELALADLRSKLDKTQLFHTNSYALAKAINSQQKIESQNREVSLRQRLARLDKARDGDEDLIKKGFLSQRASDNVKTEREQVEDQIYITKRQNIEADNALIELSQRNRREIIDINLQINAQDRQLQSLLDRQKIESVVTSPFDGAVSELLADPHEPIVRERRIATITPNNSLATGNNRVSTAVLFVPSVQGKKITVGMQAQLLPIIFEDQEYGRIRGVVSQISPETADEDALVRIFKNQKLVRKMFDNEAPYKLVIKIIADDQVRSGLAWSSSKGPDRLLEPGTIVSGWVVYDQPRLLHLLVPAIKRLHDTWVVVKLVVAVVLVWNLISLVTYVAHDNGDTMSSRAATWQCTAWPSITVAGGSTCRQTCSARGQRG